MNPTLREEACFFPESDDDDAPYGVESRAKSDGVRSKKESGNTASEIDAGAELFSTA